MKKVIAIAVLGLGVLVWRMGAMNQPANQNNQTGNQEFVTFETNDKKSVRVPKNRAMLFGTIKNLLEDNFVEGTTNVEIPVPRVSFDVFNRLLQDLDWVIKIQDDALRAGETAAHKLQRWVGDLERPPFYLDGLKARIKNLNAAYYLNTPVLMQKYAKEIASMLFSSKSLKFLYENNLELMALLDNQSIRPDLKEMIYQYMPARWIELRALDGYNDSVAFSGNDENIVTILNLASMIWNANSGALLVTLRGHVKDIQSAQFSPKGDKVVTTSLDHTAKIWNAQTGALLRTLARHTNMVYAADFSHDGNKVVTASWDKTAKIWNAITGELLLTLAADDTDFRSAEFSRDDSKVLTTPMDNNTAKIWNAMTGELLLALTGHTDTVNSATFSHDETGSKVVTASSDNTAKIWDANTGTLLRTLTGHTGIINSAVFSRDNNKVVTASKDRTAKIWNAQTGELLHMLNGHGSFVESAAFSPDGSKVVTASSDTTAHIWNAQTGAFLYKLEGHKRPVKSAAFSSDGNKVVTSSSDRTTKIWQMLPQSDFNQALFIQLLAWAMHYKKSISFTSLPWAKDTFNSYEEANKTLLRKIFPENLVQ